MPSVTHSLTLPTEHRRRLSDHALRAYPNEACGLLVGRASAGATQICRVTLARNRAGDRSRDRYLLEPEDFLTADHEARRDGLDVVGVWHTHPDHPARPSETDLQAAWPEFTYLILSVRRRAVSELTAWRLAGTRFIPQPIEEVTT